MRLLKKILYRYQNDIRIHKKIIYMVVLVIFITAIFATLVINFRVDQIILREVNDTLQQFVDQYIENVDYKLKNYKLIVKNISLDDTIKEILKRKKTFFIKEQELMANELSEEMRSLLPNGFPYDAYNLSIYPISSEVRPYGNYFKDIEKEYDEQWYKAYINDEYEERFIFKHGNLQIQLISIIQPITEYNQITKEKNVLGLVKLDLFPDKIFPTEEFVYGENNQQKNVYILDEDNKIIYPNSKDALSLLNSDSIILDDRDHKLNIINKNTKDGVFVISQNSIGTYKGVTFVSYKELRKNINRINIQVYFSMVFAVLIAILISIFLSNGITHRLKRLVKKFDSVEILEGKDIDSIEAIEGKDEIGFLDTRFNKMVESIRKLVHDNYVQQIKRNEVEFVALQSQINPHFIFNSLETISALATIEDAEIAAEATTKLGEVLRYSIGGGMHKKVTVREEVDNIKNYLYIQKLRFNERFHIQLSIPDECMEYKIVKFILQPIVENCIRHGFKGMKEQGIINISVARKDETLQIIIQDNGQGITRERLTEIRENLNESMEEVVSSRDKSIGIKNVDSRLKLAYGEKYGIIVRSKEGEGSKFILVLPVDV